MSACSSGNSVFNAVCPCTISLVSGEGQSGPAGGELAAPLVIRIIDSNDTPVLSASVLWEVTAGGGELRADCTSRCPLGDTDPNGINQATWTLGPQPGTQTVRVTSLTAGGEVIFTAEATATGH